MYLVPVASIAKHGPTCYAWLGRNEHCALKDYVQPQPPNMEAKWHQQDWTNLNLAKSSHSQLNLITFRFSHSFSCTTGYRALNLPPLHFSLPFAVLWDLTALLLYDHASVAPNAQCPGTLPTPAMNVNTNNNVTTSPLQGMQAQLPPLQGTQIQLPPLQGMQAQISPRCTSSDFTFSRSTSSDLTYARSTSSKFTLPGNASIYTILTMTASLCS